MAVRVRLPASIKKGDLVEVKTLTTHPMESGQRRDAQGAVIPRKILNKFACSYNGKDVVRSDWGAAVSSNPYFAFFVKAAESGTLEMSWTDDDGSVAKHSEKFTVG